MMRTALLFAAALLAGCRTNVALVDDTYGGERQQDRRIMHVRSLRAPLEQLDSEKQVYRFVLDLALENDTVEPWQIRTGNFTLRSLAAPDSGVQATARIDLPPDTVLITVPGRNDADLRLPIVIETPLDSATDLERAPIELRYAEGKEPMLLRRVVVGSYSQLGQGVRVAALLTAGLVLLSLL
jgi:hypothetical protein